MAFRDWSFSEWEDLGQKIGGEERAKRVQSGELILVERDEPPRIRNQADDDGGVLPYVSSLNVEAFLLDWQEFYRQVHSLPLDPRFKTPQTVRGFDWGVWVPKGMTPQRAFEMRTAVYPKPCWKYYEQSLDVLIDPKKEARTPIEHYAIWLKARVEADVELKNLSANQVAKKGLNTLTLTERLILGQWFYWKSGGKYLDVDNITLCAGSRYLAGDVPSVCFDSSRERVSVGWCGVDGRLDNLRARQAVA